MLIVASAGRFEPAAPMVSAPEPLANCVDTRGWDGGFAAFTASQPTLPADSAQTAKAETLAKASAGMGGVGGWVTKGQIAGRVTQVQVASLNSDLYKQTMRWNETNRAETC